MRKFALLTLSVLALSCSNVKDNTYSISGTIDGIEDGKMVFIQKPTPDGRAEAVDTLEIKDGKFAYTGNIEKPELHYLLIEGVRGGLPVILEEGNIKITAYKDSLGYSLLEGTPSNEDFYSFVEGTRGIGKKITALRTEMMEAGQKGDTVAARTLQEAFMDVQEEGKQYEYDFVKSHPDSYFSSLVFEQIVNTASKTPEEIMELYNGFTDRIKNYDRVAEAKKSLDNLLKVSIGAIAPDFTAPTMEGDSLSLNSIKGKVTIIDFWAAWCKPCRAENPNVVALYNKYHDKGLNIIGVSLDRKAEDWKQAVEDDGLSWNHVSSLQFWQDPVARLYNVRAIPATFILDAEGKIVAKNLRGEELEAKVEELLAM